MFKYDAENNILVYSIAAVCLSLAAMLLSKRTSGSDTITVQVPTSIYGYKYDSSVKLNHTWKLVNGTKVHSLYFADAAIEAYVDDFENLDEAIDMMVDILKKS